MATPVSYLIIAQLAILIENLAMAVDTEVTSANSEIRIDQRIKNAAQEILDEINSVDHI